MNEYAINQRLKIFLEKMNVSQEEFKKSIGIKNKQQVSNWLTLTEPIPAKHILTIFCIYSQINANWLLTGEGEMIIGQKVYPENDSLMYVADTGKIDCPFCIMKDEQIKNLEMHRDDLRKQVSLLEFSLGKNVQKA